MDRPDVRDVSYRRATVDDIEAIVALVESAYRGESSRAGWTTEADLLDGRRTDADAVRAIIGADSTTMLVSTLADRRVVGCCQLERRADDTCYFGMFAITPTMQSAGLGSGVLREAQRVAHSEWGSTSMRLSVLTQRRDLIAWYERCGFTSTGQTQPFPYGDRRFGLPRRDDLAFEIMSCPLP